MSLEIYQEEIIQRYKNPVNYGTVVGAHIITKDSNPSCGDTIEIQIKFSDGIIEGIKFQGQGCAISLSSVDILIDMVKDKNIEDVKKLTADDFLKKLGAELSPLRLKCALLGLRTLKTAVYAYLSDQTK